MRLFLVRHGESVDNVAGLYAGSRDAALTAHGVLQAQRLGSHLVTKASSSSSSSPAVVITHIFSSDLQRAYLTAKAVLDAQREKKTANTNRGGAGEVVQLPDLRERDFRSGEGVRIAGGGGSRDAFADAESRDEMRVRAVRFIDDHLLPLLVAEEKEEGDDDDDADERAVVVVSHGILLNVLLLALLQRYGPSELARLLPPSGSGSQQHRPPPLRVALSNTGYVDMAVSKHGDENASVRLRVLAVNSVEHLAGLKKTRGGIGSAKFDAKQKTMDAFFAPATKRQKKDDGV